MLTQKCKRYKFSPRTVDELSAACVEALTEANADKKDIIRVRLSLEEILESWLAALAGRDTHFRVFYRFGRKHIEICVEGPHAQDEGAEYANLFSSRLLAQSGIVPVFSYKNDCNYITISLPGPKLSSAAELVLSFTLPLVLGFLTRLLPGVTQEQLLSVTESLLEALLMLIKAVAIPMILFAVCISLMGMGDLRTMSQVGGPVIRRFLVSTLLIAVIAATVLIWCFPVTIGSSVDAEGYSGVYRLLLEILPPDIITPFKEGNALQIIFIGIVTGSGLLALGPRASALRDVVEQLGDLVNHIMGGFGKIMHVFVFLSVFNITVRGFSGNTDGIGKLLGIYLGTLILLLAFYTLVISVKYRIKPRLLLKKLYPAFYIALCTSSPAAALSSMMETCTKELGISPNVTRFAVPMGQVLFMPTAQLLFLIMALYMAESFGMEINLSWVFITVCCSSILAVACPPISGGSAGMYTMLFMQLGIPPAALALALTVDAILDPLVTSVNMFCLQGEIILSADMVGELNREQLKAEPDAEDI